MDKNHFEQLVKGVTEMKRHMAGQAVEGVKITAFNKNAESSPDVSLIRRPQTSVKASLHA